MSTHCFATFYDTNAFPRGNVPFKFDFKSGDFTFGYALYTDAPLPTVSSMAQTTANPAIFPSQRTHDSGVYAEPWSSFVPFSTNNAFDVANAADPGPSSDTIYGWNQHIVFPAPDSEFTKLAEGQHSGTIWTDGGSASTRATSSTSSWRPQLDPLIWSESFVENEKRRRTCKLCDKTLNDEPGIRTRHVRSRRHQMHLSAEKRGNLTLKCDRCGLVFTSNRGYSLKRHKERTCKGTVSSQ